MQVERAADDVARAFLLERRIFEGAGAREFDGEVVGLIGAGAFVAFGDGFEGFVPVRRLGDDWWELDPEGTALRSDGRSRAVRLGDPLRVRVRGIDAPRGRVDLEPS
ncbi:S1 RNA-binding domain-containing protein [Conexibacter sp. W3-3-2]|uniref:S1 RNA-binding domain-containing protein n=1 Tax=Conexibacter sp. W3-3-2 TaxID=2675227 RepID=UPI001E46536C|nr:S1 RNA-binding domain-containing protein [Conexibacter sp. W3-3-2]